jgi:hypothetical protein
MFKYDANKKYELTNDMKDIENYVGGRVPMTLKLFKKGMVDTSGHTEEEVILIVVKVLWFSCVFNNIWKEKGADDIRMLPDKKEVVFTALKGNTVMKQSTLIL